MHEIADLVIIGGGASGLFAASMPEIKNIKVILLEKMPEAGKKLLLSGSGQCNITNNDPIEHFLTKFGSHGRFLKPAIYFYPQTSLLLHLKSIGLTVYTGKNEKIFVTDGAKVLRDRLIQVIKNNKVDIICNANVTKIEKTDNYFNIKYGSKTIISKTVLLCPGGCSFPDTGSNGTAFHLALNHTIIRPKPALAPVKIEKFDLADIAGISLDHCSIKHMTKDSQQVLPIEDLLITHRGFSGPAILNNSRMFSQNDKLSFHWNAGLSPEATLNLIREQKNTAGKSLVTGLYGMLELPKNLFTKLVEKSGINPDMKLSDMTKLHISELHGKLCNCTYTISSCGSFASAMATAGGIDVKEIDSKTMMSRINPGMFFAGEFMDIDGNTGGYNLQAAACTAAVAVHHIKKYLSE